MTNNYTGRPISRVDGLQKVTGAAQYAAEFEVSEPLFGYLVSSPIAKGRITRIDAEEVLSIPGVVEVISHENRLPLPDKDDAYQDATAPGGSPYRPFYDDTIQFSMQPVALVIAETFELARYAASRLNVEYEQVSTETDLERMLGDAYTAPKTDNGFFEPLPPPTGHPDEIWAQSAHRIQSRYLNPTQHHNPMETLATTVEWLGNNNLKVYDKTQGVANTHQYICNVLGLEPQQVHLVSKFTGGAFGLCLRPNYPVLLAVMASLMLERSVKLTITRQQMYSLGYRPSTIQDVKLAANDAGRLEVLQHEVLQATSRFEHYAETIAHWSGRMYHAKNRKLTHRLIPLDVFTPLSMRAPGPATGSFAIESAVDELSYKMGIDPLEFRLRNYTERDNLVDKPYSSKALKACFAEGAERFGWKNRQSAPRSMQKDNLLVGWGVAAGIWDALRVPSLTVRAVLYPDRLEVVNGINGDIGTGTSTIVAQLAGDLLGLPMERITFQQGESTMPAGPVQGGSWTAGSLGTAVTQVGENLQKKLFALARQAPDSPLRDAPFQDVLFKEEALHYRDYSVSLSDIMQAAGVAQLEVEETATADADVISQYSMAVHNAVFAEVLVDELLGTVRVSRIVEAVAAGRILNPKTASSQILGSIVQGLSTALMEETVMDHTFGRFVNHSLAEYHIPVNADVPEMDVIFVEEHDDKVNPIGAKGVGEIGIVAVPAAIANAVYHATGKRIRNLPITRDKLL